jgi:NADP-dependent 3-hydroxy acid dehydrogenase YdfG
MSVGLKFSTAGASSGIGEAVTRKLASEGAKVVALARRYCACRRYAGGGFSLGCA